MSITSPLPVLHGSNGTVLRFDGDALVLRRPAEEMRIPLRAIGCIRAEGRTVDVELTAPAGTVPAVHRVDDVSEAAATLFADAVNAALPPRAEGTEVADGSILVTARASAESRHDKDKRLLRIWGPIVGLVFAALAVAVGIHGEWSIALTILPVGPFGAAITAIGADMTRQQYRHWHLPRHGITVEARRAGDTRILGGSFGTYVYTDMHGASRSVYVKSGATTIQVAYRPDKPGIVTECRSRSRNVGDTVFAVCFFLAGLAAEAVVIALAVAAFLGMYPGY